MLRFGSHPWLPLDSKPPLSRRRSTISISWLLLLSLLFGSWQATAALDNGLGDATCMHSMQGDQATHCTDCDSPTTTCSHCSDCLSHVSASDLLSSPMINVLPLIITTQLQHWQPGFSSQSQIPPLRPPRFDFA